VEATASTGGQLMPPIMGAAAFVMVEITGASYLSIITAALLPALFYYLSIGAMVHFEAGRVNQQRSARASWPEMRRALVRLPPFLVPVAVLLFSMIYGYSPILAGFYAFLALVVVTTVRKETRLDLSGWIDALVFGAKNAALIAVACATAGLVVGVIEVLGVGLKFASAIFSVSNGVFFVTLLLVMIGSIILGMGLPTTAAYVIVAAIAAPPLVNFGMSPVAAHLFVLYYACLSAITPPVAIAAYAAAGIAGCDPIRAALHATKLGSAGFIIPFAFAYYPGLLLQGSWGDIAGAILVGTMVIFGLAIAIIGWFTRPMSLAWRAAFGLASLMMLYVTPWTTVVGVIAFGALITGVYLSRPKEGEAQKESVPVFEGTEK
ncbi:TRAP transporter fused permease subunit, partial [Hoeflea sp. BAL378]|uniref:TRAP transporter permease n=1 Tax=Hoeflea sp. BAL378 TaxID=1547437 RepID=UPI00054FC1DB